MKYIFNIVLLVLSINIYGQGHYYVNFAHVNTYNWSSSNNLIETENGHLYLFYINAFDNDIYYIKSTTKGSSWSSPTLIQAGTVYTIATWYDRWSKIDTTLIHIVWNNSVGSDFYYVNLDTSNDNLSGVVNASGSGGSSQLAGTVSLCRATGGDLYLIGWIDGGTESFCRKSSNVGVSWSNISNTISGEHYSDYLDITPGWAADPQDINLLYEDQDKDTLKLKRYDASADTWSAPIPICFQASSALVVNNQPWQTSTDLVNEATILVSFPRVVAGNSLLCYSIDGSSITELTPVISSVNGKQNLTRISINDSLWTVYYCGESVSSDIQDNPTLSTRIFYKQSSDFGTTWGAEQMLSPKFEQVICLFNVPHTVSKPYAVFMSVNAVSVIPNRKIKFINTVNPY